MKRKSRKGLQQDIENLQDSMDSSSRRQKLFAFRQDSMDVSLRKLQTLFAFRQAILNHFGLKEKNIDKVEAHVIFEEVEKIEKE